jgi:hypothetical protein
VGNYKELAVWQKAHHLTLGIYEATKDFPKEEIYGLTSQMRRSAVSLPSNIAEGAGKGGDTEFVRYLRISLDQLMNWIINFCYRMIWLYCQQALINFLINRHRKCVVC